MDYPQPQMTLAEDGTISLQNAYATGIADWDKRAITYGYAEYGDPAAEADALAAQLADNRAAGFEFISDPDSRDISDFHPRSHLWDGGAEPVAELERLMALRAAALERFGADSLPSGAPLSDLQEAIVPVYLYHRYQVEAVAKLVGGADYRYALKGDAVAPAVTAVTPERQAAAVDALLATLNPAALALPASLLEQIPPKAYGYRRNRESAPARTGALFDPLTLSEAAAGHSLAALLHPERLARLALQHSLDPAQLSPAQLFARLHDALLLREYAGFEGAIDRRSSGLLLQHWRNLLLEDEVEPEVRAAALAALEKAQRLMRARYRSPAPYADFYRYQNGLTEHALEGRMQPVETIPARMPPGSPIGSPAH
jgi:hypothetical protein